MEDSAAVGHDLPVGQPVCQPFKRLLYSESRPIIDTDFSAISANQRIQTGRL